MPWARIDDNAGGHAKLLALSDGAYRLWVAGLIYCQRNLTDGAIPRHVIPTFGVRAKNVQLLIAHELCASLVPGRSPLWHITETGYQVHDFLDWNESREAVSIGRLTAKQRMALFKDPTLRREIRDRDGDFCRYCHRYVRWADKKGPHGGTYDHVEPYAGNHLENLVVACRSCNSRKLGRTPTGAGMPLLPPKEPKLLGTGFESDSTPKSQIGFKYEQASTSTSTDPDRERPDRKPQGQEQREIAPDTHAVLVRLAHDVLADVATGALEAADAKTELKHRAGKARIPYDAGRVTRALDSAEHQRRRA
ncbi:MAG: HNH endonuclease signature motif containing protein [Acidobacteriota bacterium]